MWKSRSQDPRVYEYFAMSNLFTGPRALSTHMWIDRGPWNRNSCTMFSQNLLVSRRLHFLMASGTLGRIGWGRSIKGLGNWKWFLKHRIQRDQSIYIYIYIFIYLYLYIFIYIYWFMYLLIYLFIDLFIDLFVDLFIYLSIYLYVCMCIYIYISVCVGLDQTSTGCGSPW
jgi:hypothetical protein